MADPSAGEVAAGVGGAVAAFVGGAVAAWRALRVPAAPGREPMTTLPQVSQQPPSHECPGFAQLRERVDAIEQRERDGAQASATYREHVIERLTELRERVAAKKGSSSGS